jgi:hypothetical protein
METKSKYGVKSDKANRTIDGIVFDSKMEAEYFRWLKMRGIKPDAIQPRFILQEKFKSQYGAIREICYVADFQFGKYVLDVKGAETTEFLIKKKLFAKMFPDLVLVLVKGSGSKWNHWLFKVPTKKRKSTLLTIEDIAL